MFQAGCASALTTGRVAALDAEAVIASSPRCRCRTLASASCRMMARMRLKSGLPASISATAIGAWQHEHAAVVACSKPRTGRYETRLQPGHSRRTNPILDSMSVRALLIVPRWRPSGIRPPPVYNRIPCVRREAVANSPGVAFMPNKSFLSGTPIPPKRDQSRGRHSFRVLVTPLIVAAAWQRLRDLHLPRRFTHCTIGGRH